MMHSNTTFRKGEEASIEPEAELTVTSDDLKIYIEGLDNSTEFGADDIRIELYKHGSSDLLISSTRRILKEPRIKTKNPPWTNVSQGRAP